ncbi:glycosyltransferase family 1 protein [Nocardioides sp. WL0053]|uniref:Glycosyltransferase family 1 protein n=1 Tax=Nocardioides jiangsuensis TaxID=2866161 RepID=A0ABS7RMV4_9ACTN|nr:glycosyltransferase family 1 protein [Nocardioides jiangsuensis]MBY9076367.1 glycosyltransferase family 1 protein [Nocardioides jiangsuensis]
MRVAIVTESFLPQVNGVTNTVRHVVDRLIQTGHQPLVVAPGPGLSDYRGAPVVRVRSMGLPGYKSFSLGLPDPAVERALAEFRPDVVHLASPILLGAVGLRAARRLDLPTVAVYQTDIAGFARQYGLHAEAAVARWVGRVHRRSTRTLAPSRSSRAQLAEMGVHDVHLWRRGVSLDLFGPDRRLPELHSRWATRQDKVVVGYVGRLAAEKQVRRLTEVAKVPGVRLVLVGDGPERPWLERHLPDAKFTGMLRGDDLARAFASLDVFVHPGEAETFCQTVQEAQASGVPVVAPASGGPLDLVDPGRTGLLYDPSDPRSLGRAVTSLVADPALRGRLATAALAEVQGRTWAGVVDQLVTQHYGAVALGRAGTPLAA